MQKTDFVEIPNVKSKDYFMVLRQIYSRVNSHKPRFKEFRQWMREKGWWDKPNADNLMFMLDLTATDPVAMGAFAARIVSEMDEPTGREIIGERLIE